MDFLPRSVSRYPLASRPVSPILDLKRSFPQGPGGIKERPLDETRFSLNRGPTWPKHSQHEELKSRMQNYELAYRMQMEVPGVIGLEEESEKTKEAYGLNQKETAGFGKQCLMARRLVEKGVRFVQIFSGGWDSHDYLERAHAARIKSVDQPMTALIQDLKKRGMLKDTLVLWLGEFGRTPDNNRRGGVYAIGRGHNNQAMTILMAGGGVKPGSIVGATDELGSGAVEVAHPNPRSSRHPTPFARTGRQQADLLFTEGRYKQTQPVSEGQIIPPTDRLIFFYSPDNLREDIQL